MKPVAWENNDFAERNDSINWVSPSLQTTGSVNIGRDGVNERKMNRAQKSEFSSLQKYVYPGLPSGPNIAVN